MKFSLYIEKNWYRIQYRYQNQRYGWSLGTQVEKEALAILADVERDWSDGKFDFTHERYRHDRKPQVNQPPPSKKTSHILLGEKLGEFIALKSQTLAQQSMKDYRRLQSLWNRNPCKIGTQGWIDFFNQGSSGTKMLRLLNAFLNWAGESQLLTSNLSVSPKYTPKREDSINPFTEDEVEKIIQWMAKRNPNHECLTRFMFATGCRPGEALALDYDDFKEDCVVFNKVLQENGELKGSLKTQQSRSIPMNATIKACLPSVHRPGKPAFMGCINERINWGYFSQKVWRKCLNELGIEYRNAYQMRHTAITRWINQGVSSDIIARWVGNSPAMIHKHYLGKVTVPMPELES